MPRLPSHLCQTPIRTWADSGTLQSKLKSTHKPSPVHDQINQPVVFETPLGKSRDTTCPQRRSSASRSGTRAARRPTTTTPSSTGCSSNCGCCGGRGGSWTRPDALSSTASSSSADLSREVFITSLSSFNITIRFSEISKKF